MSFISSLGFIAVTYLKLPIMAITLFAVGIAYIVVFEKSSETHAVEQKEIASDDSWGGLFDE